LAAINLSDDQRPSLFVFCKSFDQRKGPFLMEMPVEQVLIQVERRGTNLVQVVDKQLNLSLTEL
jgi:hypothetical protein